MEGCNQDCPSRGAKQDQLGTYPVMQNITTSISINFAKRTKCHCASAIISTKQTAGKVIFYKKYRLCQYLTAYLGANRWSARSN